MKPSLQVNLHQQLTMTPQLQQAIKLLQLSTLELQQEIQLQLESNPLLDIAANEEIDGLDETAPEEDYTDFQWSHLYTTQNPSKQFNQSDYPYESLHCTTVDLRDHLAWQLNLTPMSDTDRAVALTLIDATDDNGFLTLTLKALYADLCKKMTPAQYEAYETVRHRLQRFDPTGCVCVNLAETLSVQLEQLALTTPNLALAKKIVHEHLDWIAQHQYNKLIKRYQTNEKTLSETLTLIQHLNPRPGNLIQKQSSDYVIPDLMVKKINTPNTHWKVELNPTILPKLSINQYYATLINKPHGSSSANGTAFSYLRNNLHEARCFLKNIQNRQATLLKVAQYIIQFQTAFLTSGTCAMKPLTLNDVANALNLHESTISRATTQKFIHTPQGVLELKYFFTHHIPTTQGSQHSSLSIRALIKELIANENPQKPLSDTKITGMLSQQGIKIARRTITKYRELLGIAPCNQRHSIH